MEKFTKHSIQWFYNLLEIGECDYLDFKEELSDKIIFGKSIKSYAPKYDELAKDVVVSLDPIILTFEYVGPKTKVSY